MSYFCLHQAKSFTPQFQAGSRCPRPQTAACPSGASWPAWASFTWRGGPVWTAAPRAGFLTAASATPSPGPAQNVAGVSQEFTPSHPTPLMTTALRYMTPTATEVLFHYVKNGLTAAAMTIYSENQLLYLNMDIC